MLKESLWNPLETFCVPCNIFKSGTLDLTFSELALYLLACKSASVPQSGCLIELPVNEMQILTGYGKRQVLSALAGLQTKGLLKNIYRGQNHSDVGRFEKISYALCDRDGDSFYKPSQPIRRRVGLRTQLHKSKQPYFSLPACITDYLKELRGAPLAVYVAAVRLCNLAKQREITVTKTELRTLSGISVNQTLFAALDDVIYPCDRLGCYTHIAVRAPAGKDGLIEGSTAQNRKCSFRQAKKDMELPVVS